MAQDLVYEGGTENDRQFARIMYVVHALTFFFSLGTLSVLPLIANYIKRPDTAGTIVYSHHTWMIRSFWWYLLWWCIIWALVISFVGLLVVWIVAPVVWLWMAYRIIRGFIDLNNNRPMPV
ncbi:hypothetical protein [uncultured Massilia sp.]|uniref:DUF4870 family protein n=1 Tax=uncultured Massilia sp. TaxID=169973 RepID=UPI0025ED35D4|nr:hypothetical protein [uncultured Massilia sp.]